MGGKIAGSLGPFDRGLTIGLAVCTGRVLHYPITPFAGFDDRIAFSPVVGTAVLLHEDTFRSHLNRLTNHGTLPPFSFELFFDLLKIIRLFLQLQAAQKKRVTN